jgi:hypothetical protein
MANNSAAPPMSTDVAQFSRLFGHPIETLLATFRHKFGVLVHFAANYVAQTGHDVLANMTCPDCVATHDSKCLDDALVCNRFAGAIVSLVTTNIV